MDLEITIIHWFGTFVAVIYGLLIGSFLNVCIYRLPPKIYYFDDLFYYSKTGDLISDIRILWQNIFNAGNKKMEKMELEPFLYAETLWFLPIFPESAAITALTNAFNLYKHVFPESVTIVRPRSFCPHCRQMIRWWMNIPLLSFLILGGKCYYCKGKISLRYPLVEALSGLFCGVLFYFYGLNNIPTFVYYYIFTCLCIVVFFVDYDHWLILDEITIPFTLAGILGSILIPIKFFIVPGVDYMGLFFPWGVNSSGIFRWFIQLSRNSTGWFHPDSLIQSILGAVLWFSLFYSVAIIGTFLAKREAMGGGDLKFALLMGAFLGPQKAAVAFFLAVLSGTLFMLPGLLLGRKTGKDQIPFGCFLTFGAILTVFWGEKFIWLYFNWISLVF